MYRRSVFAPLPWMLLIGPDRDWERDRNNEEDTTPLHCWGCCIHKGILLITLDSPDLRVDCGPSQGRRLLITRYHGEVSNSARSRTSSKSITVFLGYNRDLITVHFHRHDDTQGSQQGCSSFCPGQPFFIVGFDNGGISTTHTSVLHICQVLRKTH